MSDINNHYKNDTTIMEVVPQGEIKSPNACKRLCVASKYNDSILMFTNWIQKLI